MPRIALPVDVTERIEWARVRVEEAARILTARPDSILLLALNARIGELDQLRREEELAKRRGRRYA